MLGFLEGYIVLLHQRGDSLTSPLRLDVGHEFLVVAIHVGEAGF